MSATTSSATSSNDASSNSHSSISTSTSTSTSTNKKMLTIIIKNTSHDLHDYIYTTQFPINNSSMTIKDLKEYIQEKYHPSIHPLPNDQRLVSNGRLLVDHEFVNDLIRKNNSHSNDNDTDNDSNTIYIHLVIQNTQNQQTSASTSIARNS